MTNASGSPTSPPGWYPDPGGQPVQRWWNGATWTDSTYPLPQAPTAAPSVANAPYNGNAATTLPPQPSPVSSRAEGGRWGGRLRQFLWASVPVWSLGILAFAPFLRLALARRTRKDWSIFAGYLAAVTVEIVLVSVTGSKGAGPTLAGGLAILLMGFAAVHTFVSFRPAASTPADAAFRPSSPPNQQALASAKARVRRRKEARELAHANPTLARELRIGRPDMPRQYDDGGLVDINHVPVDIMTSVLELTPQEASAVAAARSQLGKFTSAEELSVYAQIAPDRVDAIRDLMLFC